MSDTQPSPSREGLNWPLLIIAVVLVGAVIVEARSFLMPLALAVLLSITFSPIRRGLARAGIPPAFTALGLVAALCALIGTLVILLAEPVQTYASDSRQIAADVERKLRGISETIEKVADAGDQVEELATQDDDESVEVKISGPSLVSRLAANAPWVVGQTVFVLVLLFFITASGDMLTSKIVRASPTFTDKRRALEIVRGVERQISRYFLTVTAINAGLGVAIGSALWLLDMPTPLLFGVMAFILNFIPYVGALVGVAITFAIGIVSYPTVFDAASAAFVYLALTTLEGQFITPYAVGRRLSLNPVVVFVAVAFWGWAWSVIGMIVAVPMLILVVVIAERVDGLEPLRIFLTGDGPGSADDNGEEVAKAA